MAEEKKKNKTNWITTAIVAVVVGAVAFYGGIQYQKSQRPAFMMGARDGQFQTRFGGDSGQMRMGGMRPVMGEIISKDDKSVTVKLPDGSSKIVLISDKTAINKAAEGSLSDLKTGEKIAAFGSQNADGSVTAQNIQLNPQMRMFQRGAGKQ